MPGLGVYVQIPFCASKCTFCNFSSRVAPGGVFEGYATAIERELERLPSLLRSAQCNFGILNLGPETIYFGGGTPPILGLDRLGRIVESLQRRFPGTNPREFTLEATPGSLEGDDLFALRRLGVDRLSIGAQSFSDQELHSVGRLHSAADTACLIQKARDAGFKKLSLDLIAGLPYQTEATWRSSLETAAALGPEHLSVYLFEQDEKSRLGSEVLKHGSLVHAGHVPDEAFCADAYEMAREFLKERGYRQYEISNFALPDFESLHNLKYWRMEPYVGIGAGAHSFDGEHRWSNTVAAGDYTTVLSAGKSPIAEFHRLSHRELIEEYFFTGLRQADGVDLNRWPEGDLESWRPVIQSLAARGLVESRAHSLRLVDSAYVISNEVFQEFLQ